MVVGLTKTETIALRMILDKIAEKFGQYAYLELCEDGSGFIGDRMNGLVRNPKDGCKLIQFDGLGELSTILETPLVDMKHYYGARPGGSHGKW